jgi:hypothetical protein
MRSVGVFGASVAASGAFSGPGKSQIALLQDPLRDQSVRITVREANADGETFSESTWLATAPRSFDLARAKFAVADVNFDGNDDLVALYDLRENRSQLLVFKSTGSAFLPPEQWWIGENYLWSRARHVMAGKFAPDGHDAVVVAYQNENLNMRIHYFESSGSALTFGGAQGVYNSAFRRRPIHAQQRHPPARRAVSVPEGAPAHQPVRHVPGRIRAPAQRVRDRRGRIRPEPRIDRRRRRHR